MTIFTLSLLAVSCIDNDYDLSDIDTDDIGIGDENSVFTCPLMTLRVAVADIVNEQGDLDGILAEADVWLPDRLPDGAEAVDVKRLTGGDGQQAQQAYVQTLLTALQEEIDADASDRKLEQIAPDRSMRSIGRIFSPITSLPMWTRRSISRRSGPSTTSRRRTI